jgi:hypothetical protein
MTSFQRAGSTAGWSGTFSTAGGGSVYSPTATEGRDLQYLVVLGGTFTSATLSFDAAVDFDANGTTANWVPVCGILMPAQTLATYPITLSNSTNVAYLLPNMAGFNGLKLLFGALSTGAVNYWVVPMSPVNSTPIR